MISGDAWTFFIGFLTDLYNWSTSTIIIGFQGYSLSIFELWVSLVSIFIFIKMILSPIFGVSRSLFSKSVRNEVE